jgi:hypothetical protein
VIEVSVLRLLLLTITGWLDRREREAMAYLIEEIASSASRWWISDHDRAAQRTHGASRRRSSVA